VLLAGQEEDLYQSLIRINAPITRIQDPVIFLDVVEKVVLNVSCSILGLVSSIFEP
jgi:hypothetical protein